MPSSTSNKFARKEKKKGYGLAVQRPDLMKALPEAERPAEKRPSFAHPQIVALLSCVTLAIGGLKLIALEKSQPPRKVAEMYQLTPDQIIDIVRQELGHTLVLQTAQHQSVQPQQPKQPINHLSIQTKPKPVENPTGIMHVVQTKVRQQSRELVKHPIGSVQKGYVVAENAIHWLLHYQLSDEERKYIDPEKLDCNDNPACERLSAYGLPMYTVSIYPKNPEDRLDFSWHQFAACKLNQDVFLIVDGTRSLVWHGSLQQYVEQQTGGAVKNTIIPVVGISAYRQPYFDTVISKGLVQINNRIYEEDQMDSYFSNESIVRNEHKP